MKTLLILSAICLALAYGQSQNVTITLFATDLSSCDDLSKCDAFVRIFCQSKLSDWKVCGETKYIQDDNFPVWPEIFTFNYTVGNRDKWRFNLIDDDVVVNDPVAQVEVTIEEYLNATEIQNSYSADLNINGQGKLYIQRIRS